MTTVNINAASARLAVGGAIIADSLSRIVISVIGPTYTDGVTGYGFSGVLIRCDDDGVDENVNGGAIVSHSTGYTASAGYGHVFEIYAMNGMNGLILGSNTLNTYIRFEIGPVWPDSEVGRIRGTGANAADFVFGWNEVRSITASQTTTTVTATVGTFTSADVGRWVCWNETSSNKANSEAYRITDLLSSTTVTVDTSKTIASQPCRISSERAGFDTLGALRFMPQSSATPTENGQMMFQATSNTSMTFKYRGTDGTLRSGSITLS